MRNAVLAAKIPVTAEPFLGRPMGTSGDRLLAQPVLKLRLQFWGDIWHFRLSIFLITPVFE
jgi:hypothetical protein